VSGCFHSPPRFRFEFSLCSLCSLLFNCSGISTCRLPSVPSAMLHPSPNHFNSSVRMFAQVTTMIQRVITPISRADCPPRMPLNWKDLQGVFRFPNPCLRKEFQPRNTRNQSPFASFAVLPVFYFVCSGDSAHFVTGFVTPLLRVCNGSEIDNRQCLQAL